MDFSLFVLTIIAGMVIGCFYRPQIEGMVAKVKAKLSSLGK